MAEEIINTENEQTNDNLDYIDVIQDYKENYVPKSTLEAKDKEIDKLKKALFEGESYTTVETSRRPSSEISAEIFSDDENLSNLDAAKLFLELRDSLLAEGKADGFTGFGIKFIGDESDPASAEKAAAALQSCIDYADGDSALFSQELQRIMTDTVPAAVVNRRNRHR